MGEKTALCLLALSVSLHSVTCIFFHEPSAILLKPGGDPNSQSDFGFSMGYWKDSLIVGSPRSDSFGEVYRCPVATISNENNIIKCSVIDLKIKSTNYSREISPNQYFYLGASIATTKDYFFTCAPLVTKTIQRAASKIIRRDAFGSCFVYFNNETSHQYKGPDDRFLLNKDNKAERFHGGTGWTTLADEVNGLLIIAKSSLVGDINYIPTSNPWKVPPLSFSASNNMNSKTLRKYYDIGYGLTAGKFFSNKTVYAFSMQSAKMNGEIVFMEQKRFKNQDVLMFMQKGKIYNITNKVIGGMFGYTLGAADLNLDGLSELLVGAPAQSDEEAEVECGALHIYIGGDIDSCDDKSRMRTIFGATERGRFGTAISASDVDGDNIPEIFVSAPYEDTGVVYVLSGYELNRKLIKAAGFKQMLVSELQYTQRVVRSDLKQLGFSLQPLPDLDGNGCNELAIGGPGTASVLLLRCLQTVNVTVTSQLTGSQNVREKDKNFTVTVCLQIGYSSNTSNVSGIISAMNDIVGPGANIPSPIFKLDLSEKRPSHCENISVKLTDFESADYKLVTQLELENIDNTLKSKDFDQSSVVLSPYSLTKKELNIVRRCSGDECIPLLSMKIIWKETKDYEVGSSETETVSITVKNDGFAAYGACVRVGVSGAQVSMAKCQPNAGEYVCLLPKPLRRDSEHTVNIVLNMTQLSNADKNLIVTTRLYENCDQDKHTFEKLVVDYSFNQSKKDVHLLGVPHDLQITDKEILDQEIQIFTDEFEYWITNNGSVLWKDLKAVIGVEKRPFINKVDTTEKDNCEIYDDVNQHFITCIFTLPPRTTKKIISRAEMSKTETGTYLNGIAQKMNVTSKMKLFLDSSGLFKMKELICHIRLNKDLSFKNNMYLIIVVAVILAVLLLALITYILYKNGFFKRQEKKRLDVLRESVRKRSIRLASDRSSRPSHKTTSVADADHLDIEVVEDCAFEEIPVGTNDDVMLVESQADVHNDEPKNETNK